MTADEYVPSEDDMRETWVDHESKCMWEPHPGDPSAEFDRFLARVRRDAARDAEARIEAVQHLIDQADEMGEWAVTCTRLQWAIDGSAPQPGA